MPLIGAWAVMVSTNKYRTEEDTAEDIPSIARKRSDTRCVAVGCTAMVDGDARSKAVTETGGHYSSGGCVVKVADTPIMSCRISSCHISGTT